MNIAITIWVIIAALIWGDWKGIRKYHHTMLYVSLVNLLYYYLTIDYPMWEINVKILPSEKIAELLHVLIIMTFSAFLFLSNFPNTIKGGIFHILKWVIIFSSLEWIGYKLGRMEYHNGWNIAWSILFNFIMFPFIKLNYHKPVLTYLLSVGAIIFFMWMFNVPF